MANIKSPGGGDTPQGTTQRRLNPVSTQKSSALWRPAIPDEEHHPHACTDGLVFLTYTTFDEEVGDEVERIAAVPCRRCAEYREAA